MRQRNGETVYRRRGEAFSFDKAWAWFYSLKLEK